MRLTSHTPSNNFFKNFRRSLLNIKSNISRNKESKQSAEANHLSVQKDTSEVKAPKEFRAQSAKARFDFIGELRPLQQVAKEMFEENPVKTRRKIRVNKSMLLADHRTTPHKKKISRNKQMSRIYSSCVLIK